MTSTSRRALAALSAVPVGLAAASAIYQRLAERRDTRRFPPPGELVDVGGRRLHVFRSGTGKPVVIVVPALSTPADEWVRVQRCLADVTDATTIVVDRAGIGWSDPGPWPRTISAMADEVDVLVHALGIDGPVVLAGHSVGGLIARLYAARHRDRVARLILVDSSHEDQNKRLHEVDPSIGDIELAMRAAGWCLRVLGWKRLKLALGLAPDLRRDAETEVPADLVDAHLATHLSSRNRRAVVQEFTGVLTGREALRDEARDLGDMPVTVVTAGPVRRENWYPVWCELQAEFLTMSTNATHIWARHSSHHINHDDPGLLARVIGDAVREVGAAR
ncbi:alpha/beta fold hydrolase [Amycolatopsis sp. GM8]|uniref:alpha/beta fold hydrolase n=1 Tax=Amycolatopsis sp. GM8 TaxID=2896530 RepID=UPI001F27B912|nr:alpha/beta hydrolase [Amycolatopsis sp. GM8]